MIKKRQHGIGKCSKAFVSFDAMFSLLPIVLMVVYVLLLNSHVAGRAEASFKKQVLFDKLVSVSDYVVNKAAAHREGEIIYPNWIDSGDFGPLEGELGSAMKLDYLRIGFDEGLRGNVCISRIVAFGPAKEIRKIYFCGG